MYFTQSLIVLFISDYALKHFVSTRSECGRRSCVPCVVFRGSTRSKTFLLEKLAFLDYAAETSFQVLVWASLRPSEFWNAKDNIGPGTT